MASVHPRKNKGGIVTAWLVKWRLGGARTGPQQTERFDPDEEGRAAAEVFKEAVNAAGQQWPPGWVKGRGMVGGQEDEERYTFARYAVESVLHRSGVEDRYRDACLGELKRYLLPEFGTCDVRSTEHFSRRAVQAWVNRLEQTEIQRGSKRKTMSPKTIKNLHGLLSSILQEAVEADPPLRDRNPCKGVRLPRTDDDGTSGEETDEDIEFLEPAEVAGIAARMRTGQGRRLVEDLYATGARWGEASAWAVRHMLTADAGRPKVRIVRAWKWSKGKGFYLGPPKSKRSRRTISVPERTYANWVEQGLRTKGADDLVYANARGERLPYSTFYDEWTAAVGRAKEDGVLPVHKSPTIHDLRHSHAAALISAGHSLTYVQHRLGHESIKTTSDVYGHLLPEADDAAMATIDASLGGLPSASSGGRAVPGPRPVSPVPAPGDDRSRVHVVLFPTGHAEAFWRLDVARLVGETWQLERRTGVRVEQWPALVWEERFPGRRVHEEMPGRAEVWEAVAGVAVPRRRWVWEWERGYSGPGSVRRSRDGAPGR